MATVSLSVGAAKAIGLKTLAMRRERVAARITTKMKRDTDATVQKSRSSKVGRYDAYLERGGQIEDSVEWEHRRDAVL